MAQGVSWMKRAVIPPATLLFLRFPSFPGVGPPIRVFCLHLGNLHIGLLHFKQVLGLCWSGSLAGSHWELRAPGVLADGSPSCSSCGLHASQGCLQLCHHCGNGRLCRTPDPCRLCHQRPSLAPRVPWPCHTADRSPWPAVPLLRLAAGAADGSPQKPQRTGKLALPPHLS